MKQSRFTEEQMVAILLDVGGHDEVEIVARKIIATVETPFQLGAQKQNVDIGTSIGIALYPAHARDADALIKAADAAMYSAKQMPGSSFRFAGLKPITV